ncbi:cupin domain-containing protein [Colwellia sp. RE-S-Sl-9]
MASVIEMLANSGNSKLVRKNAPDISIDEFPEGWDGVSIEYADVFMFIFTIQPDAAEFPIHSSQDKWLAYVISGSGTLIAGNSQNEQTQSMEYKAGDFISFEADTPHGWKNNKQLSKILFTKTC